MKRSLSIVLCLCLAFALLPARVAEAASPKVWVAGVNVIDGGYYVNSDATIKSDGAGPTHYNVYYSDGTLHLNGLEITGSTATPISDSLHSCTAIYADGALTLSLEGADSSVATADSTSNNITTTVGLYVRGDLTVTGSKALTAQGGDISVSGALFSYGVHTRGLLTVQGGRLQGLGGDVGTGGATGPNRESYGVYALNGIRVENGVLEGKGGAATGQYARSYGVYADNGASEGILLSGGSLTGVGNGVTGTGTADSYGIYTANPTVTVTGGRLTAFTTATATAGTRQALSHALTYAPALITAKGNATSSTGTGAVEYDGTNNGTYLWVSAYPKAAPPPSGGTAPVGDHGDGDPMAYTAEQLAAMRAGTLAGQPGADGAAAVNGGAGAQGTAGIPVAAVPATGDAPWWVRVWRLAAVLF